MRYGMVLGALGFALAAREVGSVSPAAKGPAWLNDYVAARLAARQRGLPIFVVFR